MTKANNKKGFTIIEVVLVLAIAGLIFLMVFIALPALQRSQRNTRRRADMARILSAFNDYQAANGVMPNKAKVEEAGGFVDKYIKAGNDDAFTDPDGTPYSFITASYRSSPTSAGDDGTTSARFPLDNDVEYANITFDHQIYYNRGAKCGNEEGDILVGAGQNQITLIYALEGGAIYCGDNQ